MAAPTPTDGLIYRDKLRIGLDELQWLQAEYHERRRYRWASEMLTHGFVTRGHGGNMLGTEWAVVGESGGTLDFQARDTGVGPATMMAVDENGEILELPAVGTIPGITVSDDSTWRTLLVRKDTTEAETGTMDVTTASTTIMGTGTNFTRYTGKTDGGYGRGTLLRISGSANGNDGTIELDTVTSDTLATVVTAPAGTTETDMTFQVEGAYATTPPGDPDIHQHPALEWDLVAQTGTPPAGGWLIVADTWRAPAGIPVVVDRRRANVYRRVPPFQSSARITEMTEIDTLAGTSIARIERTINTPTTGTSAGISGIRTAGDDNSLICVMDDAGSIEAATYNTQTETWSAVTNVTSSGTASRPTVEQMPPSALVSGTAYVNIILYVENGTLRMKHRTIVDVYTGESTIWDPNANFGGDTLTDPDVLLLQSGRLLAIASYDDTNAGERGLRYIYSDDFGATWSDNSDAGFTAVAVASDTPFRPHMCQGEDGLIHVVYQETASDIVYHFKSTSKFDLSRDNTALPGTTVANADGAVLPTSPRVWVAPGDSVIVGYMAADGGVECNLRAITFGGARANTAVALKLKQIANVRVSWLNDSASSSEDIVWDWVQAPDGVLHAVVMQSVTSTFPFLHRQFIPQIMPTTSRYQL